MSITIFQELQKYLKKSSKKRLNHGLVVMLCNVSFDKVMVASTSKCLKIQNQNFYSASYLNLLFEKFRKLF